MRPLRGPGSGARPEDRAGQFRERASAPVRLCCSELWFPLLAAERGNASGAASSGAKRGGRTGPRCPAQSPTTGHEAVPSLPCSDALPDPPQEDAPAFPRCRPSPASGRTGGAFVVREGQALLLRSKVVRPRVGVVDLAGSGA